MFGDVKKAIVGAAAILALVPSASLLSGLVALPEDFNRFLAFTAAAVGPVVLFVSFLVRPWFARLPLVAVLGIVGAALIGGLWLAMVTNDYLVRQIEDIPYAQPNGDERVVRYVKPETLSEELDRLVNGNHGGLWRYAIVDVDDGDRVKELMREESRPVQRRITILFNAAHALLILAFLLAAFSAVDRAPRNQRMKDSAEA